MESTNKSAITSLYNKGVPVSSIAKMKNLSIVRIYQIINSCTSINEEKVREKLHDDGFIVTQNGYPDFFCFNPETKKFKFVEVKSETDKLKKSQKKTIKYLKKAGLKVEVIVINKEGILNNYYKVKKEVKKIKISEKMRNKRIQKMAKKHLPFSYIGEIFGVTKGRISQIIKNVK